MPTQVIMYPPGVARIRVEAESFRDRVARDILADMRRYVPVLTGALLSTLRIEPGSPITRLWAGDVSAGIDYHIYQEYGTSRMAAQSYFRPAVYQYRVY